LIIIFIGEIFNHPEEPAFFGRFRIVVYLKEKIMKDWLRTLLAGYGAYKWGGGCLGTVVVFLILYWLLGFAHC
jgi:hypothetical protein